jgi:hypothetical protein
MLVLLKQKGQIEIDKEEIPAVSNLDKDEADNQEQDVFTYLKYLNKKYGATWPDHNIGIATGSYDTHQSESRSGTAKANVGEVGRLFVDNNQNQQVDEDNIACQVKAGECSSFAIGDRRLQFKSSSERQRTNLHPQV